MRKYRYTTTACFKKGEEIWLTGFKGSFSHSSGRKFKYKYLLHPVKRTIFEVRDTFIVLDREGLAWNMPYVYYLDTPDRNFYIEDSLNLNIAKTKEEAQENFNLRILEEIDYYKKSFLDLEGFLITCLL